MNKYEVDVDWAGYSRGYSTYIVEAESEEEAMNSYYLGEKIEHETVRDDTDSEVSSVTLIKEEK